MIAPVVMRTPVPVEKATSKKQMPSLPNLFLQRDAALVTILGFAVCLAPPADAFFYLLCKVFWPPFVSFISSLVCWFVCLFLYFYLVRWSVIIISIDSSGSSLHQYQQGNIIGRTQSLSTNAISEGISVSSACLGPWGLPATHHLDRRNYWLVFLHSDLSEEDICWADCYKHIAIVFEALAGAFASKGFDPKPNQSASPPSRTAGECSERVRQGFDFPASHSASAAAHTSWMWRKRFYFDASRRNSRYRHRKELWMATAPLVWCRHKFGCCRLFKFLSCPCSCRCLASNHCASFMLSAFTTAWCALSQRKRFGHVTRGSDGYLLVLEVQRFPLSSWYSYNVFLTFSIF